MLSNMMSLKKIHALLKQFGENINISKTKVPGA